MKKTYTLTALLTFMACAFNCGIAYAESAEAFAPSPKMLLAPRATAPARELSTITVSPAPGMVKSINEVKVAFIGVAEVKLTDVPEDKMPVLLSSDDTEIKCSSMKVQGNTMILNFSPEVTAEDTYTLLIPAACFTVDGETMRNDLSYDYFITATGDTGIIYDEPAGQRVNCQSDFLSYFVLDGGLSGMPLAGKPLHYVIGDDGNLYLYNIMTLDPYGGSQTSSYVVGTPSGDNRWKFTFPQPIYQTISDGEPQIWYLNYLYTAVDPTNHQSSYQINEDDNSVEFEIDENGNAVWVRDAEDPEADDGYAIGATYANGVWTGFANVIRSTYQKFTDVAPEIDPEEFEIWKLTTGPNGKRTSRNVDVYFDGDDVWIRGLSKTYLPKAWAHGTISGKNIVFDPYIGECSLIGQYLFLYGYESAGRVDLKFKYYAEEKGMRYNGEYIINPNQMFYYAVEAYEYPSLEYLSQGSGIETVEADDVVSVEWFTINGVKMNGPVKGINIARKIHSSGKVEYCKIINR